MKNCINSEITFPSFALFLTFSKCNFDVNLFRFVEMPGGVFFTQRKINNNNNLTAKEKISFEIQYCIKQTFFSNEILKNNCGGGKQNENV